MINMHCHTARCGHAEGSPAEFAAAARDAGLEVLGFADHLPLPPGFDPSYAMPERQLVEYAAEVGSLRDELRATGGPEIALGIEADWLPSRPGHVERLLGAHEFDVVFGSVHFLGDWAFDDPALIDRWRGADVDDMWRRYFAELAAAARSGLYDVMAHPDLVKKFGHRPSFDPAPTYAAAAEAFARAGVAVEVNTAGLRKPCAEIYPCEEFLSACRRAGVRATVGTDAHRPSEVAAGLADARALLIRAGYRSVAVYRSRRAEDRPIA